MSEGGAAMGGDGGGGIARARDVAGPLDPTDTGEGVQVVSSISPSSVATFKQCRKLFYYR